MRRDEKQYGENDGWKKHEGAELHGHMDAPFGKTRAHFFRRERQAVKKEDNRYTVSRNPFDMQRTTGRAGRGPDDGKNDGDQKRSEEPTSELQSLMRISYAAFCLYKSKPQTPTRQQPTIHL